MDDLDELLEDIDVDPVMHTDREYLEEANERRIDWIARKQKEGFRVDFPGPNELFIDLDTKEQARIFRVQLGIFERNFSGPIAWEASPSKSGPPKLHVRLQLPFEVTELQRIAFQAVFGSDPVREMLSLARHRNGDDHPTLFLEKS